MQWSAGTPSSNSRTASARTLVNVSSRAARNMAASTGVLTSRPPAALGASRARRGVAARSARRGAAHTPSQPVRCWATGTMMFSVVPPMTTPPSPVTRSNTRSPAHSVQPGVTVTAGTFDPASSTSRCRTSRFCRSRSRSCASASLTYNLVPVIGRRGRLILLGSRHGRGAPSRGTANRAARS